MNSTHRTCSKIRNLVGDRLLYAYNPKDRRGVRYVFTDGTFLGAGAALKHAEEIFKEAS